MVCICREVRFIYIDVPGLYMWEALFVYVGCVVYICGEAWFVYVGRNRTDIKVSGMEMCP